MRKFLIPLCAAQTMLIIGLGLKLVSTQHESSHCYEELKAQRADLETTAKGYEAMQERAILRQMEMVFFLQARHPEDAQALSELYRLTKEELITLQK